MRALLPGLSASLAAIAFLATPAAALDPPSPVFVASSAHGVTVHHGLPPQWRDRLCHLAPVGETVGTLRRQAALRQRHQLRLRAAAVQPGEGVSQLRPGRLLPGLLAVRPGAAHTLSPVRTW